MNYTLSILQSIKTMINVEFCEVEFKIMFNDSLVLTIRAPVKNGDWFNYSHSFTKGELNNIVISDATMIGRLADKFKDGFINVGGEL